MQTIKRIRLALILLLALGIHLPSSNAQSTDDAYKSQRQQAMDLYRENKTLEGLPLFEDLAKKNPNDDQVLVALASCLISHSATLQDQDGAANERVRAKELLLKAKALGNTSTLMQNLLETLTDNGKVQYSTDPTADTVMRQAEAAFARRDYDEAIKFYSKALELDSNNYSAQLFIGDSYFAAKKFPEAAVGYERAILMEPNRETAYRYYADMLTKNGDMDKARALAIQAVIAGPYDQITWRALQAWAQANHLQLNRLHIDTPQNVSAEDPAHISITMDSKQKGNTLAAWLIYSLIKAGWQGDEFKKHFPGEANYRHSLEEETEALTAAAETLAGDDKKKKALPPPKDPNLALLLKVYQAGMIEPYVLLSAPDEGISKDYPAYREKNRAKLEQYLSTLIVPPAPPGQ
jgi:tetratricopeptide (TPR) repeat protein